MNNESRQIRRRLIKAGLGAPAIFTLPSGAALAATSASCALNSQEAAGINPPPGLNSTTTDGWVRQTLVVHSATVNGATTPVQVVTVDGSAWFDATTGSRVTVTDIPTPTAELRYALVDYAPGAVGGVAGVFPQQQVIINPIAGGSCWTSLTGVNIVGNILG